MPQPPLIREIDVEADPATAFRVFTDRIGRWWPVDQHSVHGAGSRVAFVDGELLETAPDGTSTVWGTVREWTPPEALAFSWHPGGGATRASQVRVTFTALGDKTRVRLEHGGWEVFADPVAARQEYDHGWPGVLDDYGRATGEGDEDTWVALLHEPTPGLVGPVFADPRFADHARFLQLMRRYGYLVAAGPFKDAAGSGMTILRLPGADRLAEATTLATQQDAAVTGGLLEVTVRPWLVMLSPLP